ncbi:MAG: WD40 repeat domain-containing protein [Planctomycetota bacterium]|nr:WD40 repeat domain-containing protein [Planctomycetota bacterium]
MKKCMVAVVSFTLVLQGSFAADPLKAVRNQKSAGAVSRPYITTQTPLTLLSANDGDLDFHWRKTREGLRDREVKTQDSVTVIHLGPDHPPITRTVYGTVPSTILGTPTMAMSADGRYGIVANHGFRGTTDLATLIYPKGMPVTNEDVRAGDLARQNFAPPLSKMLSLIDLASPQLQVVDRELLADGPIHVLAHPDGKHFVVGAVESFYVYQILNGKLVQVSRSPQEHGLPCFWITPKGDRIIATQGRLDGEPASMHWYELVNDQVRYLSEVKVNAGVDTMLTAGSYIVRVSLDGKQALVCQDSGIFVSELCDIPIVDLTLEEPAITSVIKHVGPGVESFAFHPNGKMAVATCLAQHKNSIAILDIASKPARLLYHLDASGFGQGIEFTPEGDRLFVGSAAAGRIEVYDVLGDYEVRKNQKFLKTGHGHCSLTIGPRYLAK